MVIRCTIINRISRVGDIGEPGYSVYGEDVPACKKSGSHDHWHGATQGSLIYVMPTCYITRSVYNFLTESERNEIRSKVRGVCEDDCIHRIPNPYYGGGQCWALNESKIITDFPYPVVPSHPFCLHGDKKYMDCGDGTKVLTDICIPPDWYHSGADCEHCALDSERVRELADGTLETSHQCVDGHWIPVDKCADVSCGIICDGYDLYSQKCVDGKCVKDALLVANSPTCGYTRPPKPECTEGDKKPGYMCSGGKWVPVGTTPPPPPECTEGDKKPGYMCSGGKWVPVGMPPGVEPKYLTAAEASERFRMGLPCYIKCVLPILDMLPGLPYTPGAWVLPFCAITTEQ